MAKTFTVRGSGDNKFGAKTDLKEKLNEYNGKLVDEEVALLNNLKT